MEIVFKIAKSEDVENIVNLCNLCFDEKTSMEYAKGIFEKTKNDPNQVYIIGYVENEAVAHAKITIIPTMYEKMNTYAILNHVCVHPDYRRRNIATEMLIACEKVSKEKGCVAMELWSNNSRVAAHACYKHFGFIVNDAKFFSKEVEK